MTVTFVVGNRTSVSFSLLIGANSIYDSDGNGVLEKVVDVDVTKIRMGNVFSPVDIDVITSDSTIGDASEFNVLVCKVGSPSYKNYLSTMYKDGYSVVEYADDGSLVLSDNSAIIALSKSEAKQYLGGATKEGGSELFIADPNGKRAIVVELDTTNKTSTIIWEYASDKVVSDFNRVPEESGVVNVLDSGVSNALIYVRRDVSVTWYNNTNETIRIMSGTTTYDQFYADPDFDLFGEDFDSGNILPGEYYSFRFINLGTFNYFVYPFIYTGKTSVIETSITPDDTFVLAENDPSGSSYLNRIIKIDAWGNIVWSFGESFVSLIKDAKPTSSGDVIVTV